MRWSSLQHLRVHNADLADEVGNKTIFGETVNSGGFVKLLDFSLVHHCNAVRQCQRLILGVGDEHECDPSFFLQIDQLDLHLLPQLRIQRPQRFIQQQQARAIDQSPGKCYTLLLSA